MPGEQSAPISPTPLFPLSTRSLGNVGTTVFYSDPVDANPVNQIDSIRELAADINSGKVDLLVILGSNPVYDAPADLDFANVLKERQESRCAYISGFIRTKLLNSVSGILIRRMN